MKLNTEYLPFVMAKAHDDAIVGPGSLLKRSRYIGIDNQRVIANHLDSLRESLKQTFRFMGDYCDLTVYRLWSSVDPSPKGQADTLMSKADSKNWFLAAFQDLRTYSKILRARRVTWAWRNNRAIRIESLE